MSDISLLEKYTRFLLKNALDKYGHFLVSDIPYPDGEFSMESVESIVQKFFEYDDRYQDDGEELSRDQLHIKHKIPFNIDPVKALEYGKCNFCGKWYGDCKGH